MQHTITPPAPPTSPARSSRAKLAGTLVAASSSVAIYLVDQPAWAKLLAWLSTAFLWAFHRRQPTGVFTPTQLLDELADHLKSRFWLLIDITLVVVLVVVLAIRVGSWAYDGLGHQAGALKDAVTHSVVHPDWLPDWLPFAGSQK